MSQRSGFLAMALWGGFAFLYMPILVLIIYSFNDSKLVAVWGGFSVRWYGELFQNRQVLTAAWLSMRIAFITACLAVVLGTLAGLTLARFGRFKGRALFSGLVSAPLVMPEVITGLSMLMLFVSMEQLIGWPQGRGMMTVIIGHVTFASSYVAVIVQSRLVSMDGSIEEAAMDLGARPYKVFLLITLPIIAPALISGWLLSFTLSLDDLVITSFLSGPGASTLPQVIFSKVRLGVSPDINALATLVIAVVSLAVIAGGIVSMRADRRRALEERMAYAEGEKEATGA
jgi:putrescine transport system permease protein